MRVVIAGGHGQIALRLERLLPARGDEVVGLIRRPDHAEDLVAAGAEPTILRPGRLTDEPGTGLVTLLAEPGTARRTLELIGGDTPLEESVKTVAS